MLKLGLSPCVWGHPNKKIMPGINQGSIPMCMGTPAQTVCYDIVSGGLSPCVWGHLAGNLAAINTLGSIPMCMGPPKPRDYARDQSRVYPHVYGATFQERSGSVAEGGLSPCV